MHCVLQTGLMSQLLLAVQAPTDDPVLQKLRGAFQAAEAVYEPECAKQKDEITGLGGLHVIGTGACGVLRHTHVTIMDKISIRSAENMGPCMLVPCIVL